MKKKISSAIDKIKSNQDLTDMKGALEEIKSILDLRKEKNNTLVIFLTDGSLTLADIPLPEQEDEKPKRDKTTRSGDEESVRTAPDTSASHDAVSPAAGNIKYDKGSRDSSGAIIKKGLMAQEDKTESSSDNKSYLEQYRKDLKDLCYRYRNDGIVIDPIAFTNEADLSLLEEIASITRGACYKAEEAKDLRVSFIEILKSITSRFIKVHEQTGDPDITGELAIGKYIREMIVIGLKNNFNSIPQISITGPSGEDAVYDDVIDEGIFRIVKIKSPDEGIWSYQIAGDAVFVYDMFYTNLLEPSYSLFLTGAQLILKAGMSDLIEAGFSKNTGDFKIAANITDPKGSFKEGVELLDDGKDPDENADDGIFTGIFKETDSKGFYTIDFIINNIPTGSSASRNITLEMMELPVIITFMEPSDNFYITEKPVDVRVGLEKNPDYSGSFDINDYKLTYNATGANGEKALDLVLLDSGSGSDEKAGDGLYSASYLNTETEGKYTLEFFIRDASEMNIPAFTGKEASFELRNTPPVAITFENNLFTGEPTSMAVSFEDLSAGTFNYSLTAPDGTVSDGALYDDGNAGNMDKVSGDGIYSASLGNTGEIGNYSISLDALYKPGESDILVKADAGFKKEFQVTGPEGEIAFNDGIKTSQAYFTITSQSEQPNTLSIDRQDFNRDYLDNGIVRSIKISGSTDIKAGEDTKIILDVGLADEVGGGQYKISVPVSINADSSTDIDFTLVVEEVFPAYLMWIVIGASVLAAVVIFFFVYFLYIRPRKRGY